MTTFLFFLFFSFGGLFGMDNEGQARLFNEEKVLGELDFAILSATTLEQKKDLINGILSKISESTCNAYNLPADEIISKIRRIRFIETPDGSFKIDVKTTDSTDN